MLRILISILLLFSLTACSFDDGKGSSSESDIPSSAVENDENQSEEPSDEEGSEEEHSQESLLNEVKDMIQVDFEVQLPSSLPIEEGHFLSAIATSDHMSYEVAFFEVNEPIAINDEKLKNEEERWVVKGKKYESSSEANEEVGYQPIQDGMPEIDLGHGITGYEDAGAGSVFITWHEGRWSFTMRSQNQEEGIEKGERLAAKIVDKLEEQLLPVPHQNGAGIFSSTENENHASNRMSWQEEQVVYEVYGNEALELIAIITEEFH